MTFENLQVGITDGIARVTVNRPKALNALNQATIADLEALMDNVEGDDTIKVVIFTGAGEKAFVAGGDISVMAPLDALQARAAARRSQLLFNRIENSSKISIAAINGYALGGGCELAMACDLRIAADSAKLGQPESNLGILPGWGGTQRLPRLIGKGKAKELMLTGDMVDAEQACRLGLVNQVVPVADLQEAALELAGKIAGKPQVAVRLIKEAVDNGLEMETSRAFAYEADLFGLCFATEDQKEGMTAFLEKRQAVWKNR
ncbi:MAG: crotonase [Desulfuromonas sp.]|nr:MAG: crotonase [Desulfuromonas sp.]